MTGICKEIEEKLRKLDNVVATINDYYYVLSRKDILCEPMDERQQATYDIIRILHEKLI